MRAAIGLAAALAAAAAGARDAEAGPVGMGDLADLAKREEKTVHQPFLTGTLGFHGDIAAFAEVKVGYGYGKHVDQFLFDEWNLWRAALAVRGAIGRHDSVAASALLGYGTISLVGLVVEAGVDAKLTGTRNLGPIVQATVRVGPIGLGGGGWVHLLEDERDWGWNVGLSWTFGDFE